MKQGALIYDPCLDRMDIRFGLNAYLGGLHCGECFDVWTGSHWEATRIEKGEDWYLVLTERCKNTREPLKTLGKSRVTWYNVCKQIRKF